MGENRLGRAQATVYQRISRISLPVSWSTHLAADGCTTWAPAGIRGVGATLDGKARAERLLGRLQAGASDKDALLRAVLDVLAESGRIVAPDCRLRAFCAGVLARIKKKETPADEAGVGNAHGGNHAGESIPAPTAD